MDPSRTEQLCMEYVRTEMAALDPSHDVGHIKRVLKSTKQIFNESSHGDEVDSNLLIAIAALHDCLDHKYLPKAKDMEAAEARVRIFLTRELEFLPQNAQFVIDSIHAVSYRKQSSGVVCTENQYLDIVRDADRLDAIGAIGIARCMAFSGARGFPIVTDSLAQETSMRAGQQVPYNGSDPSAVYHFYSKLLKLKDTMKTEAGKRLAEQRHKFLEVYLDQLFSEIE